SGAMRCGAHSREKSPGTGEFSTTLPTYPHFSPPLSTAYAMAPHHVHPEADIRVRTYLTASSSPGRDALELVASEGCGMHTERPPVQTPGAALYARYPQYETMARSWRSRRPPSHHRRPRSRAT